MRWPILAALCVAVGAQAQVFNPPTVDLSGVQQAEQRAQAAQQAVTELQANMPKPATTMPPPVASSSAVGTDTVIYALANHTHASKARSGRVQTDLNGYVLAPFAVPFAAGVTPRCSVDAEVTAGVTDVVAAQMDGTPTNTGIAIRVNRTQRSVASLLGLTVLSIPTQVGVQWAHYLCIEP